MREKVLGRFLKYISIDTQSDPESKTSPSTSKQFDLARILVAELEEMKDFFETRISNLSKEHGGRISLTIEDSYYNMREVIEDHMEVVDIAVKAMENLDIEPRIIPIRGGTDGSRLSFMGLPCPNLFAGGINFHGRNEMISVEALEAGANLLVEIAKEWAAK